MCRRDCGAAAGRALNGPRESQWWEACSLSVGPTAAAQKNTTGKRILMLRLEIPCGVGESKLSILTECGEGNNLGEVGTESGVLGRRFLHPSHLPNAGQGLREGVRFVDCSRLGVQSQFQLTQTLLTLLHFESHERKQQIDEKDT